MRALVCGVGESVQDGFKPPEGVVTIGVNDVCQYFPVDHLIVIDHPRKFSKERQAIIKASRCGVFWYGHDAWGKCHPDMRHFETVSLHAWDKNLHAGPIPGRYTSCYPATHFAFRLGARDIAIIGCDLNGHRELWDRRVAIAQQFRFLVDMFEKVNCRLVNLSNRNNLRIQKMDLQSWLSSEPAL